MEALCTFACIEHGCPSCSSWIQRTLRKWPAGKRTQRMMAKTKLEVTTVPTHMLLHKDKKSSFSVLALDYKNHSLTGCYLKIWADSDEITFHGLTIGDIFDLAQKIEKAAHELAEVEKLNKRAKEINAMPRTITDTASMEKPGL